MEGDFAECREEAARAAELAARADDRRTELLALSFQAQTETLMGHPDAPATIKRALKEPQDPQVAVPPQRRGRDPLPLADHERPAAEARATITSLLREVRRRGMVESEVHFLRGLAETELRSGHCGRALDLARREPAAGPGHRHRRGRLRHAHLARRGRRAATWTGRWRSPARPSTAPRRTAT